MFFAVYKPADGGSSEQPWLVVVTLSVNTFFLYILPIIE